MKLNNGGKKAAERKGWAEHGKERYSTSYDIIVNILLLLVNTRYNQSQVLIVVYDIDPLAIQGPGLDILVVCYIDL